MKIECSRCEGQGQVDTLKKVTIHEDRKTCSYVQAREACAACEGVGFTYANAMVLKD